MTFDYTGATNKVVLGSVKDVSVDKAKMKIMFDLATTHVPANASVVVFPAIFSQSARLITAVASPQRKAGEAGDAAVLPPTGR